RVARDRIFFSRTRDDFSLKNTGFRCGSLFEWPFKFRLKIDRSVASLSHFYAFSNRQSLGLDVTQYYSVDMTPNKKTKGLCDDSA
ncbi:MAG: hypothetical protein DWI22_00205, partial [Planctomycetota bacterium]